MNKNYLQSFIPLSLIILTISGSAKAQFQINDSLSFQNQYRIYNLYVPKSYSGDNSYPLVLIFHGTGGNGAEFLIESNLITVADTAGFLVVSPTATDAMGGNWNWYKPEITGVDDPAFVSTLLDTLIKKYSIDTDRIYCTGQSRGGLFCYALACKLSNRITAIAPIAGTMFTIDIESCAPSHPMPVFHIHGTRDEIVPLTGRDFRFLPVPMVLDFWCNKNKTDRKLIISTFTELDLCMNDNTETIICDSDQNGAIVKFLKINGGRHSINMTTAIEPGERSLAEEIWIFFNNYSLDQW